MTTHEKTRLTRVAVACLLALAACRDDQDPTSTPGSGDTTMLATHLGPSHPAWQAAAMQMELDR